MKKTKNHFNNINFYDIYLIIKGSPHLLNLYIGFLDSEEVKKILNEIPQTKLYYKD